MSVMVNVNSPLSQVKRMPTSSAGTIGGIFLRKRADRRKASSAAPHARGMPSTALTMPTPKRIIAPAIMPITMGRGSQAITRPMIPEKPSAIRITPART